MRVQHRAEFEGGFFPFGFGLAARHDAGAGVNPDAGFLGDGRADRHGELAVERRVDPAHRRAIPAPRDRFQIADETHSVFPWVAAQSRRRVQGFHQRQDTGFSLEASVDGRMQVLDMLQLEQARRRDLQPVGQGQQAIANLVHDNSVLLPVLVAAQQFPAQARVIFSVVATADAACQTHSFDDFAPHARQQFRGRAVKGEARPRLEQKAVTIGVIPGQMAENRHQAQALFKAQFGRAGQHNFIQFTRAYALGRLADHRPPHVKAHRVADALQRRLPIDGPRLAFAL